MLAALPVPGGFRILLAPDHTACVQAIERVASCFDRVVVDVPAGPALEPSLARCHAAVLVIAPTPTSVHRARDALGRCDGVRWAIVINRLGLGGEMGRPALERLI